MLDFNKRTFLVKVVDSANLELYENHSTFHDGDAGLDLFTVEDITIQPKETRMVDLGIQCQSRSLTSCMWKLFKLDYHDYHSYWLVPRSSMSKTPLMLKNSIGLIDKEYTGNIKAAVVNLSDEPFYLKRGQRYFQLVNGDLSNIHFEVVDQLRDTTRKDGGFGSTGR
jgi:dUTP pyrophosphatase